MKWWKAAPALAFAVLVGLELWRPLRKRTEPKLRRDARNLAVAGLAGAAMALAERPLVLPFARTMERRRWRPGTVLALVLMDYTFYNWHLLTHRVPWLWRFHRVHHADLDLDASTALRFHFGEMVVSVPWRLAQVLAIGVTRRTYTIWQTVFFVMILFHHSNLRLPVAWERRLVRLLVTPRMHGIHHSVVKREVDSNWSSGLTVWDWLHGTLRLDVPQDRIEIGVPEFREPEQVTLPRILAMPFTPVQ